MGQGEKMDGRRGTRRKEELPSPYSWSFLPPYRFPIYPCNTG